MALPGFQGLWNGAHERPHPSSAWADATFPKGEGEVCGTLTLVSSRIAFPSGEGGTEQGTMSLLGDG